LVIRLPQPGKTSQGGSQLSKVVGLLDREEARDLKPLLEEEQRNAERVDFSPYVDQLKVLIGLLNLYIEGKIDLYSSIAKDIKFSNLD
jgi:hypothetical protein